MPSHFHLDSVLLLWACLIHQQHQEWSGKTVHIKDHHANITPLSCEQLYKWQNEVWCWNPRSFVSLTHTMTPGSKLRCWKSPLSLCNHPYEPWHSSLPYVLMPYSIRVHVSIQIPSPILPAPCCLLSTHQPTVLPLSTLSPPQKSILFLLSLWNVFTFAYPGQLQPFTKP